MLEWLLCLAVMAGTYCGVLADPDPLPATLRELPAVVLPPPEAASATAAEGPPQIDLEALSAYLWGLDAPTLIRIAWAGTGQVDRALAIARRESGFNCAAKNRHSSASGVFQMLDIHRARVERLGFSWADIAGPSCFPDVMVAFNMWQQGGWAPWRT